jgi:hypothetical protein
MPKKLASGGRVVHGINYGIFHAFAEPGVNEEK